MENNFINIVLHEAQIPQNTGNIARMCVSNNLKLHLIEPLGFKITDKNLKRAGLDYWQYLDYETYPNWETFLEESRANIKRVWLLTTKSKNIYWKTKFQTGDYLVFGSESKGLPESIRNKMPEQCLTIPMSSNKSRSLNLASSVQTVYYEAFRQLDQN